MMKVFVRFAAAILFLLMLSQVVSAQQSSGGGTGPAVQNETGKTLTPEQFQERKAHVLKMIEERRAKLDQAKACVEATTNIEELRKCRPEPPMGMGPGGMNHGGAGQRKPPMAPMGEPQ